MNVIQAFKQKIIKGCKLSLCVGLVALSTFSFYMPLKADNHTHHHHSAEETLELGIYLETEFWTLVQEQKIKKFSKKLASIFQGLNVSGIYNREQQIAGLTGATLASFILNNPVATRFNDVLVFSYDFIAIGSNLTSGPSITVWKKSNHSWKIVSHSYVPFID